MRAHPPDEPDPLKQKTIFCTECGVELENFCFSSNADDIEAIRKTLAQCKKKGKFAGGFCSKLFVADNRRFEWLWDNDPAPERDQPTFPDTPASP